MRVDQEEGRNRRVTQERRCVWETETNPQQPSQTYIRSALRLSYDGFCSVCILHGIRPARVISWNAPGIFLQENF